MSQSHAAKLKNPQTPWEQFSELVQQRAEALDPIHKKYNDEYRALMDKYNAERIATSTSFDDSIKILLRTSLKRREFEKLAKEYNWAPFAQADLSWGTDNSDKPYELSFDYPDGGNPKLVFTFRDYRAGKEARNKLGAFGIEHKQFQEVKGSKNLTLAVDTDGAFLMTLIESVARHRAYNACEQQGKKWPSDEADWKALSAPIIKEIASYLFKGKGQSRARGGNDSKDD